MIEEAKAEDIRQFYHNFRRSSGRLKQQAPDTTAGFTAMSAQIMQDAAVPLKTKELIAVAVGAALQCEPCIRLHVQRCLDLGLTKAEILDAASVAVLMGGCTAWTQMPIVLDTIEALENAAATAEVSP
jgi:AhpD family alkylhydroperoxidase